MRSGVTPGKWVLKNSGNFVFESEEMLSKWVLEAKRVQVKDLSSEGMAMNMKEPAGHMCR